MKLDLEKHYGVVLAPGSQGAFDSNAATFCCAFIDPDDPETTYLYYSGAETADFSSSSIGLAVSKDGLRFRKASKEPILENQFNSFCSKIALTPAVVKIEKTYYMVLAGSSHKRSRRIGIAYANDPKGPFHVINELLRPSPIHSWEGYHIDCGSNIAKKRDNLLIYYSNVSSQCLLSLGGIRSFISRRRYLIRRIGILGLKIRDKNHIQASRWFNNPLQHLNGPKGAWNESLFCPGYLKLGETFLLFPATSTYSIPFPYKQYIGLVESSSPFFSNPSTVRMLINGPKEKCSILSAIKSEIALDTPSPLFRPEENRLYLYYSVMDRFDGVWKTSLSTFRVKFQKNIRCSNDLAGVRERFHIEYCAHVL